MYYRQEGMDGVSKSSKTQSAEEYLRMQNQQTINRQNLYKKLFKSFDDARFVEHEKALQNGNQDSGSASSDKADQKSEA